MLRRSDPDSNYILNEVLVALHRSLPLYLSFAEPWVAFGNEEPRRVLTAMVAEKREGVARLTALLDARRYAIGFGEFPMDFTSLHDLSLDFLLQQLLEDQKREVLLIESCLDQLTEDAEGRALVADILASERRHLQSLEELTRQPAAANAER
jgi:hypothetical protein